MPCSHTKCCCHTSHIREAIKTVIANAKDEGYLLKNSGILSEEKSMIVNSNEKSAHINTVENQIEEEVNIEEDYTLGHLINKIGKIEDELKKDQRRKG